PSYAWRLADNTLVAVQMLAQFLQRGLTQNMRTALASPCKLDNLLRDNAVREIVGKPERYASHFERDSQNPLSFGIRIQLLSIRSDGHANPRLRHSVCCMCASEAERFLSGETDKAPMSIRPRTSAR